MINPQKPVVWLIDYNHWERAAIGALLIERGFEVEGFATIFHAVTTFYREIAGRPAAVVLELKDLPSKGPELHELIRMGAPVILLTGVYEERESIDKHKWASVLRRPFTIGRVAEVVERVVGKNLKQ